MVKHHTSRRTNTKISRGSRFIGARSTAKRTRSLGTTRRRPSRAGLFSLSRLGSSGWLQIKRANPSTRLAIFALAFAFVGVVTLLATRAAVGDPPLRDRALFGAYLPDLPSGRTLLPQLESKVGQKMQIASSFTDWSYVFGGPNDTWQADGGKRQILYSWEPQGIRFTSITNHEQDKYLQSVADSMKNFPYDIYVRPWGEMNANWSSWQPLTTDQADARGGHKPNGGTPAEFIAAWRYTVNYLHNQGVRNLKFVFNPDASDFGNNTKISTIWPGAEYVDVLGIDGYNWGKTTAGPNVGAQWQSFSSIFNNMYGQLTALHPTAPVWICEFSSKEPSKQDAPNAYTSDVSPSDPAHSKGDWWNELLGSTDFPRLKGMAVFSTEKERDWRIDSSDASLNAVKTQLASRKTTPTTPPPPPPSTGGAPDLVVTSVTSSPVSPIVNQGVRFTARVKNQGTVATPAGVKHGVSFDINGVQVTWSDNYTSSIPAGGSVDLTANSGPTGTFNWTPTTAGTYSLSAFVDDAARIAESNDANNTLTQNINVSSVPSGPPDLIVTALTASPAQPGRGQPVTFSATVKNQGTGFTPSAVIHGVSFNVNGSQVTWSDNRTTAIGPGESVTLTATGGPTGNAAWRPTAAGTYTVQAVVDDVNRIPNESNESNNSFSKSLNVVNGTGWRGQYYDNADLTGLKGTRTDPQINFLWLAAAPLSVLGSDTFSVRWTADVYVPTSGTYTFTTRTDDGTRLWVNNQPLVNQWVLQSATQHSGSVYLNGGQLYPVTMEFYDNAYDAVAQLFWSGPGIGQTIIPTENVYPKP